MAETTNTTNIDIRNASNNNHTQSKTDDIHEVDFLVDVTFAYTKLHNVFGTLGFLLNMITFIAILHSKQRKRLQLNLLASLAVSDMSIALLSAVYYDLCFDNSWSILLRCPGYSSTSNALYFIRHAASFVYLVSQFAGLFTMYAVTIDLLCAVTRPLRYRQCHPRCHGNVLVISLWIVSVAIVVLETLLSGLPTPVFSSIVVMALSAVSFIPVSIMYIIICCVIRRHVANAVSTSQTRSMSKAVRTMLLLTGTYFVCMMPAAWILLLVTQGSQLGVTRLVPLYFGFHFLYVCNTVFDPIIDVIRIPEVRQSIVAVFKKCFQRPERGDV